MFYKLYTESIFAYILRRVYSYEDAQDIHNTAFTKTIDNFHKLLTPKHAKAYLFRAAYSCIVDHIRKSKKEEKLQKCPLDKVTIISKEKTPELSIEDKENILILKESIAELRPRYCETITLFYFEEKTSAEIARLKGETTRAIENVIKRARKQLKAIIERKTDKVSANVIMRLLV